MLDILRSYPFQENTARQAVMLPGVTAVDSVTFGLLNDQRGMRISQAGRLWPGIARVLNAWFKGAVGFNVPFDFE